MKGWRTVLFNVLAAVVPIAELVEFADIIPQEYKAYYYLGVVLANIVLRKLTTTPLGKSE